MPKKSYIIKVDKEIKSRGKVYKECYFAGTEKGSLVFKPKAEDAQVFITKKDAQYWIKYMPGEIIDSSEKKSRLKVLK